MADMTVVSDAQMWALIVGFASPLLIAVVQQPRWSNTVRVWVAVGWSVLAGAGTAWFNGEFSGRGIVSAGLVVCVAAIASYQNIWKPSKIAPMIEAKTSPGGAHVVTEVRTGPQAADPEHPSPQ